MWDLRKALTNLCFRKQCAIRANLMLLSVIFVLIILSVNSCIFLQMITELFGFCCTIVPAIRM